MSDQLNNNEINSVQNPHSCAHCARIVIRNDTGKNQSFSYDQVETAAHDGCSLFMSQLAKAEPFDVFDRHSYRLMVEREFGEDILYHVHFWWSWGQVGSEDHYEDPNSFVSSNNPISNQIASRPLNLNPSSTETIKIIRKWLKKCAKHKTCRQNHTDMTSGIRPTRILEVGADENSCIQLIDMAGTGADAKYLALSYCWGNVEQKGKCVEANFDALQRVIPMLHLPKTVQDAVRVTRWLGFKYLWIDRLCIIQDDDYDMKNELRKMNGIYLNAYLVISAASAASSDEGFLHDRTSSETYGDIWRVAFEDSKQKGSVLLCNNGLQNKSEERIDTRAWTMQEHYMAFRLLRYGSKQIEWKCCKMHTVDGGCSFFPKEEDPMFFSERTETRKPYVQRKGNVRSQSFDQQGNMNNWMSIVSRYSRRQISVQKDRLPAISAIAASFANTMGWDHTSYFAGLWKCEFGLQLLWYPTSSVESGSDAYTESPSWSWASFAGCFDFYQLAGYPTEALLIDRPFLSLSDERNPFGHVTAGSLKIAG